MIAQADQFKQKVDALKLSTDDYGQMLATLKKTAQDTFTNGLGTALSNVLSGTQSVGQAFSQLGLNFAQTMLKLETQFLASQFMKWLTSGSSGGASSSGGFLSSLGGVLGGGAGAVSTTANTTALVANTTAQTALVTAIVALTTAVTADVTATTTAAVSSAGSEVSDVASAAGNAAMFAASGGQLIGPSHSSGGVMVEAEGGEFIVNKNAVARPGVQALLQAINGTPSVVNRGYSGLPAFGSGGAVGAGLGGGGVTNHLRVINLLDADDLVDHIASSPRFDRTVVNSVIKNGNTVRQGISDS